MGQVEPSSLRVKVMRRRVQVAVVLLLVLFAGGVGVVAVGRAAGRANAMLCVHKVKHLWVPLHDYHESHGHFPGGTVPNAALPPDRRLSWLARLWPESNGLPPLDAGKAWDASGNLRPRSEEARHEGLSRALDYLHCPANPDRFDPALPSRTDFVGVASLPVTSPRAGAFGHDRVVTRGDLKDGLSTTMLIAEVADGGPWAAGGRATVRGLEPGGVPYLGRGGQFWGHHDGSDFLSWSRPAVSNVLLADGSVRRLSASVSPGVIEALATIAGGEEVGPFDE
jgi:hypothetical protein